MLFSGCISNVLYLNKYTVLVKEEHALKASLLTLGTTRFNVSDEFTKNAFSFNGYLYHYSWTKFDFFWHTAKLPFWCQKNEPFCFCRLYSPFIKNDKHWKDVQSLKQFVSDLKIYLEISVIIIISSSYSFHNWKVGGVNLIWIFVLKVSVVRSIPKRWHAYNLLGASAKYLSTGFHAVTLLAVRQLKGCIALSGLA